MRIDLGDAVLSIQLEIPGLQRYRMRRHYGAPRKHGRAGGQAPAGKSQHEYPLPVYRTTRDRPAEEIIMDLQADQEVTASVEWTDEMGNVVGTPSDASVTWSTDNPAVLDVVDSGDGSAVIGAVGGLGTAHVRVEATAGGKTHTGEDEIVVVAGLAERVNLAFSEPRERTPDDESPIL